jgi:mRNA-degrading endonuclease RelE of RelBE toxin-antitoxin system
MSLFSTELSDNFKKEAKKLIKKYPSIALEIADLLQNLESNPTQGEPLGRDCYKIRMAISSKNKGKSGGSRVITCVKVLNETVFLLSIYDKSEKENIEDSKLKSLLEINDLI